MAFLQLFKELTLQFSQADVPLVSETLPALFSLRDSMNAVVEDKPNTQSEDESSDDESLDSQSSRATPAVIRIAAQASIFMIDKYLDLCWECDIYVIAIGIYFLIFGIFC
jgi:hypothetical protein